MKKEEFVSDKPYVFIDKIMVEASNKEYQQLLEGLINSYDVETCIHYLFWTQPFQQRCNVQKVKGQDIFYLLTFGENIKIFEYILDKIDDYLGWIPAQMVVTGANEIFSDAKQAKDHYNKVKALYEGKFDYKILDETLEKYPTMICVFQMERKFAKKTTAELRKRKEELRLPRYIYHVTHKENLYDIERYGFQPKTINKVFEYPDRIYFFTDKTMAEISPIVGIGTKGKEKVIITLETDKIGGRKKRGTLPDKEIIWYEDPNFTAGIYTTDSIPSTAIVKIEPLIEY